jgi:hypothetical protein
MTEKKSQTLINVLAYWKEFLEIVFCGVIFGASVCLCMTSFMVGVCCLIVGMWKEAVILVALSVVTLTYIIFLLETEEPKNEI